MRVRGPCAACVCGQGPEEDDVALPLRREVLPAFETILHRPTLPFVFQNGWDHDVRNLCYPRVLDGSPSVVDDFLATVVPIINGQLATCMRHAQRREDSKWTVTLREDARVQRWTVLILLLLLVIILL